MKQTLYSVPFIGKFLKPSTTTNTEVIPRWYEQLYTETETDMEKTAVTLLGNSRVSVHHYPRYMSLEPFFVTTDGGGHIPHEGHLVDDQLYFQLGVSRRVKKMMSSEEKEQFKVLIKGGRSIYFGDMPEDPLAFAYLIDSYNRPLVAASIMLETMEGKKHIKPEFPIDHANELTVMTGDPSLAFAAAGRPYRKKLKEFLVGMAPSQETVERIANSYGIIDSQSTIEEISKAVRKISGWKLESRESLF